MFAHIKRFDGIKKSILIISLVYIASQSMLLIISGRWWDDWCFYNQRTEDLIKIAMESGRPSFFFLIKFAKLFSEDAYRILIFIMFYFGALFFYGILRRVLRLTHTTCCIICCLYIIIPANDARIMLSVFSYSIGNFFFLFGFYILTFVIEKEKGKKKIVWRLVDLILFWCSYVLNSNLVLYAIPLLYILIHEGTLQKAAKYIDYLFLPIVFYLIRKKIFVPYGGYKGYNQISVVGIMNAMVKTIPADIIVMMRVAYNLIGYCFIPLLIVILLFLLLNRKKIYKIILDIFSKKNVLIEDKSTDIVDTIISRKGTILFLIGCIVLSAGLFPYIVVRGTYNISITGLEGRDGMLVPLGASLIIYILVKFMLNREITVYIYALIIMCGVIHFNVWYLAYQSDYYRQLGFQYQLAEHEELRQSKNIVYLSNDNGRLNGMPFYALNANAEMVYGDQTRFIMAGFESAYLLQDDNLYYFVESGNYHMMDYDTTYKTIDAVIEYSNTISTVDTLKLKAYEIFRPEKFEKWIHTNSDLYVMFADTDEYRQKLEEAGYANIKNNK